MAKDVAGREQRRRLMESFAGRERLLIDLLSVAGVAHAELADPAAGPAGVRVRLAAGADPGQVGAEVRRVLNAHGLRGRVAPAETASAETELEVQAPSGPSEDAGPPEMGAAPPPPPGASRRVVPFRERSERAEPERRREGLGRGLDALLGAPAAAPAPPRPEPKPGREHIAGVGVEETAEGVTVAVKTSEGRTAAKRARWSEGGLNEAVVAAVSSLLEEDPPRLLQVEERTIEGSTVLMVLMERIDGTRRAGSALVENGPAYAVARAVWAAMLT